MTENIFNILLVIHILFGGIGLIVGTILMFLKKGNTNHKKLGLLFFISMLMNAFCSLVLAIIHPNLFLFIIGIFSIYLAITGRRHLKVKLFTVQKDAVLYDWILSSTMLLFGLILIIYGWMNEQMIYLFFGILTFFLSSREMYVFYTKKYPEHYFIKSHIGRMIGSYITALTAFIVVNDFGYVPNYVKWIGPTILFVPLIIYWQKKYTKSKISNE